MKLYATVASERASKGQGGNDYLSIEVFNKNNDIIAVININHPLWFKNPQMSINYNSSMLDISRHNMELESQKIKGEKQKTAKDVNYLFENVDRTINRIRNDNDTRYDDI